MINRLFYLIGFITYLFIVVPLYFPYVVIRGFKKTEEELFKPLHYFIDRIN